MTTESNTTLRELSDSDEKIDGSANDIPGRGVKDKNGDAIGTVQDLLIDDAQNKIRFVIVDHAGFLGFGETRSCIPVDAITRVTPRGHLYRPIPRTCRDDTQVRPGPR